MKYHIWHEDKATVNNVKASTTQFWEKLLSGTNIAKNVEVRGFNGNSKLYAYVSQFNFNSPKFKNHKFYIFLDCVIDNASVYSYYKSLRIYLSQFNNVYLADLLSFEYLLLSFSLFENWIEPPQQYKTKYTDMLLAVRNEVLDCIENNKLWTNNTAIVKYVLWNSNYENRSYTEQMDLIKHTSSENIVTTLLSHLTNGLKTDFKVTKTLLGDCWFCTCINCNKCKKDRCKLAVSYPCKTSEIKIQNIWHKTKAPILLHSLDNTIDLIK